MRRQHFSVLTSLAEQGPASQARVEAAQKELLAPLTPTERRELQRLLRKLPG